MNECLWFELLSGGSHGLLHQVEKKCSTNPASEHVPNNGNQGDQCKQEKGQNQVSNDVSPTERESLRKINNRMTLQ